MQNCGLTVLRTRSNTSATKRWSWSEQRQEWRKTSYEAGAWFEPTEVTFEGIDGLAAFIERLSRDPRAFIVRGALTEAARTSLADCRQARRPAEIRRWKHDRGDALATLAEVPRRWLMIDVDDWPLPPWGDLADDPALVIEEAVRQLLPAAFHDVRSFWQLSASAGFVAGVLKAHVFFMLAEPATSDDIKASLAEHAPGIDLAPFSAAQPHFTAAPVIEGGHDPVPVRTGWLAGIEDVVTLPSVVRRPDGKPAQTGSLPPGDILAALACLGHGEGRKGFHEPLRAATLRYARQSVRFGGRDDEQLKAQLRDAIRSAPVRDGTKPSELEQPYTQQFYLQSLIDGAFRLVRSGDADLAGMAPHHKPATGDAYTVRREMRSLLTDAFERARSFNAHKKGDADHDAIAVGVGLGKTSTARELLGHHIETSRKAALPHRVLYLVPHHRLSNEILTDMRDEGLNAAVWRGRTAEDPEVAGGTMCRNLERVAEAVAVAADVESAVCGKPGDAVLCPFRGSCAYQRQKDDVAEADVAIAANTLFFDMPPPAVLSDKTGLLIADESWWQQGLAHSEIALDSYASAIMADPVLSLHGKHQVTNEIDTDALHEWTKRLVAAVEATPVDGLVSKDALHEAGISILVPGQARKLEWRRKRSVALNPGLSPSQWKSELRAAAVNASLKRRAAAWAAVEELLIGEDEQSGRLQHGIDHKGNPALVVHHRRDVRPDVAALPTLLMDATAPLDIIRRFLPRVRLMGDMQATAPHLKVTQILGGWGKTSLMPASVSASENARREGLLGELADFVRLHGQGGQSGVITYQDVEDRFASLPRVRTGHFGKIAGLNVFANVGNLFIVGRPLANFDQQLADARALTGRPIAPEKPHKVTRGALMADGSGLAMNVRAYRDTDLEAVRAAVTDTEIVQAVGRGRGVNRGSASPLAVWIMADVVTPLPVDNLVRWEDVRLKPVARMLARGVVLFGPRDAWLAYPDLFESAEAARKALVRDLADIPLCRISLREMSAKSLREVHYRPNGRGQQNRRALVLPHLLDGLRWYLEGLVGDLAHYEVTPTPNASNALDFTVFVWPAGSYGYAGSPMAWSSLLPAVPP